MGDFHFVPTHIVHNHAGSNADMTTVQTTQRAESLYAPVEAGAAGAAERLPCMHLNNTLMNFATCHLTIQCRPLRGDPWFRAESVR